MQMSRSSQSPLAVRNHATASGGQVRGSGTVRGPIAETPGGRRSPWSGLADGTFLLRGRHLDDTQPPLYFSGPHPPRFVRDAGARFLIFRHEIAHAARSQGRIRDHREKPWVQFARLTPVASRRPKQTREAAPQEGISPVVKSTSPAFEPSRHLRRRARFLTSPRTQHGEHGPQVVSGPIERRIKGDRPRRLPPVCGNGTHRHLRAPPRVALSILQCGDPKRAEELTVRRRELGH
jgi:hypothetical protein